MVDDVFGPSRQPTIVETQVFACLIAIYLRHSRGVPHGPILVGAEFRSPGWVVISAFSPSHYTSMLFKISRG